MDQTLTVPEATSSGSSVRWIAGTEGEGIILTAARASTNKESKTPEQDVSLMVRLLQDGHTSPFEFVFAHFHVIIPIWMARQLMRHRTLSYAEFSKRYSDQEVVSGNPTWVPSEVRKQGQGMNKQVGVGLADSDTAAWFQEAVTRAGVTCNRLYQEAIERGVERGQARTLLPQGQMTSIHVAGNLKNWIDFLALRHHADTQQEHQEVAALVHQQLSARYPLVMAAADRFRFKNTSYSVLEHHMLVETLKDLPPDVRGKYSVIIEQWADKLNDFWFSAGEKKRAVTKLLKLFYY